MRVFIEGIGLLGPGLRNWEEGRAVLSGESPFQAGAAVVEASELLPPAERRRTPVPVKIALAVGQQAFRAAGRDMSSVPTVFTSSSGEGETLHHMCETLASEEREVSPTRFHNSVHNAAAGYWSIATRCREPSTSLCAYDASFAAGLLEAVVQVISSAKPVALIAYDQPYPEPLHSARPIPGCFGAAFVFGPERSAAALAVLEVALGGEESPTRMIDGGLETLRSGIPAARALPLLRALALNAEEKILLEFLSGVSLSVTAGLC